MLKRNPDQKLTNMAWRWLCVYQHAAGGDGLFGTVSPIRFISFSKEEHRSLALGLFTLWPCHEIDVEILVQVAIPSLHDALAIDSMKVVTSPGLASKLAQCRIGNASICFVPDRP